MNRTLVGTVLGAMLSTSVQATSIFGATDSTGNSIQLFGVNTALTELFGGSDMGITGDYRALQASGYGEQVFFTLSDSDSLLTNAADLMPNSSASTGSSSFALAAWSPQLTAWVDLDAAYCSPFSGSCSLNWSGQPLPASVSLLGFGALGLVVVGRRRGQSSVIRY